jgi:diamine N-acetyltransferase
LIIGKRVRLRAIERTDLPRFVNWLNDPEVLQHLLIAVPMSLAQEEKWFDHNLTLDKAEQPLAIEVDLAGEWLPIGNISLMDISSTDRYAELGIFIGEKQFWNQGYGGEAIELMLAHGFNHLNLNRIYLRVIETNSRGIRCYERVGFIYEGRMRQARFEDGQYIDVLLMSVLRTEWQNTHPTQ